MIWGCFADVEAGLGVLSLERWMGRVRATASNGLHNITFDKPE